MVILQLAVIFLFFVPAGVGVMEYFGLIRSEWMPIVVASVFSTAVVLAVTGWMHQLSHKYFSRHGSVKK